MTAFFRGSFGTSAVRYASAGAGFRGFDTMFFLVTLYMEEVLGYSAIRTGLCYLPLTAAIGLGAGVATKGIPKIGTRPLIVTGALLGAAGVFLLSRVPLHGTYPPDILPGIMIMGPAWAS